MRRVDFSLTTANGTNDYLVKLTPGGVILRAPETGVAVALAPGDYGVFIDAAGPLGASVDLSIVSPNVAGSPVKVTATVQIGQRGQTFTTFKVT